MDKKETKGASVAKLVEGYIYKFRLQKVRNCKVRTILNPVCKTSGLKKVCDLKEIRESVEIAEC